MVKLAPFWRQKMIATLFQFLVIILVSLSNVIYGQVYHAESLTRFEFGLSVNSEGEWDKYPSVLAGAAWVNDAELLDQDLHLQDLIELSEGQRQKFKRFYQNYRGRIAREFPGAIYDTARIESAKQMIAELQAEFNAILTETQQEQFRQASHRMQSQLFGVSRTLMLSSSWPNLTSEQRRKIRQCIHDHRTLLSERRNDFLKSHLRELTQIFNTEQSRDYREMFADVSETHKVPFELLAFQLQLTGNEDFMVHMKKDSLSALYLPTGYALFASGRLLVRWSKEVSANNVPIARLTVLRDPQLAGRLDLSEGQIHSLAEIAKKFQHEYSDIKLRMPLPTSTDRSEDPEVYLERSKLSQQKLDRYHKEVVAPFYRSIEKAIDDVLIPHQQRTMTDVILQTEIQRIGLSAALVYGGLGKRLKITEQQQKRILSWRTQQLAKLLELMWEMEDATATELREIIGSNDELNMKTLIGEKNEKFWPAPGLLLTDPIIDF